MYSLRSEIADDQPAVFAINRAAFPSVAEARLVDRLRERAQPYISFVALSDNKPVGHICFTPVTLEQAGPLRLLGLAPMSVLPAHQGKGVGSALVNHGLDWCRQAGFAAVVVLGHPKYYPRFGFVPASQFGLTYTDEVPDEAFMALELQKHALLDTRGTVSYHPTFEGL